MVVLTTEWLPGCITYQRPLEEESTRKLVQLVFTTKVNHATWATNQSVLTVNEFNSGILQIYIFIADIIGNQHFVPNFWCKFQ